jgi:murein L,D-transpeptidase YcbB/YkuD
MALDFLRCQPVSQAYQQLQHAWSATLKAIPDSLRPSTGNAADFRRVALNLERLRWDAELPDSGDYALVNIAAYQLQLFQQGRVVQTHRVVVGKVDTPTPTLDSRLTVFVTAREWRIPYSIAVREILPELQDDPGFLADNDYQLFNYRNRLVNPWRVNWHRITPQTFPYTIRQAAGRHNALGNIVFYFANSHGVYLHDTPARSLFREPHRARSHGCIRVEKPLELAAYLLRREGQQAALPDMRRSIATRTRCRYDLAQGLPIRIRYYTCTVENNQLRYYADVYCQDEVLAAALLTP